MNIEHTLGSVAKAIVGGAVAASAVAMTALSDGHVTPAEWVGVGAAFLSGLGIVYVVPNNPQAPHTAPDVPEMGHAQEENTGV